MRPDVKSRQDGRYDAEVVEVVLGAQREIEVLRLLARGPSNKQIAEQLVISPKTVANHVEHIHTNRRVHPQPREPVRDAA